MNSSAPTCLLLVSLASGIAAGQIDAKHSVKRADGIVPDKATAIRIAEGVLIPVYGEKQVKSERPYVAALSNEVWTVTGSLPKRRFFFFEAIGGVAIVELSKKDARILRVTHGR
jgi:hypothetical protein